MWKVALVLYQLLALGQPLWAHDDVPAVTPQDCSLDCIRQGGPVCEYCRITRADVRRALGFNSIEAFGSCIPWPCFELLGEEDPTICQHYVQAPNDVTVEFVHEPNPKSETIVVSWKPSYYGITFLRGFQVSLQALGGSSNACQLFLFHLNLSLTPSHAQRVYTSDPFPGLSLGSQYAVTVMALPVPEKWEKFYQSKIFSTRSCAEKNGLEECRKDWYPKHVEVQQKGAAITVTFNLAPPNLGIRSYFSLCYANGMKNYIDITPNSSKNKTHHSYQLNDLQEGTNYTCELFFWSFPTHLMDYGPVEIRLKAPEKASCNISRSRYSPQRGSCKDKATVPYTLHVVRNMIKASGQLIAANEMDAVRKTFSVQVMRIQKGATPLSVTPSLALILPLCLAVVAIVVVLLAALTRPRLQLKKLFMKPAMCEMQHHPGSGTQEEVVSLPRNRLTPPRLLICYSSYDGPAHVKAVMQLGAFIQEHMATQVCLDLWDSLSVAEEGSMAWHCRQIRESNFILVICSQGLNHRPEPPEPEGDSDDGEADGGLDAFSSDAAIKLIGEEVGRAKARGQDLSKYMAAIFEYSEETDIPTELRLVSPYTLTRDLSLLFSHLHGVALHRPGGYLKINHISEEGFTKLPSGAALQWAISEAGVEMRAKSCHSAEGGD